MKYVRTLLATGFALVLALGAPRASEAQVYIGPQVAAGSDSDFGVGGRLLANIENANLEFVSDANVYFTEGPVDFWELNGNVFYHFHLPESPNILPFLGGGLNVMTATNGNSQTEAGLNLGGGIRFPAEGVTPYFEGRWVASDFDQFVVTVGFLFGHAHGGP